MHLYIPSEDEGRWGDLAPPEELAGFVEIAESRLKKLVALSEPPVRVACKKFSDVEEWVHPSGKMVVIGDGVHPLTVRNSFELCDHILTSC